MKNHPKSGFIRKNQRQASRESSVDHFTSEQNRDNNALQKIKALG